MKTASHLVVLVVALVFSIGAAAAKDTSDDDGAALVKTVESFDKAMGEGDYGMVVSMVPEKVFAAMAEKLETTPDKLSGLVADQMEEILADVKILEFEIDAEDFEIEETGDGIAYTFLPTRSVIEVQDTKVETRSFTLALRDGEEWGLVRVDDLAQLEILRDVYPGFAGVEFPKATTKLIK